LRPFSLSSLLKLKTPKPQKSLSRLAAFGLTQGFGVFGKLKTKFLCPELSQFNFQGNQKFCQESLFQKFFKSTASQFSDNLFDFIFDLNQI